MRPASPGNIEFVACLAHDNVAEEEGEMDFIKAGGLFTGFLVSIAFWAMVALAVSQVCDLRQLLSYLGAGFAAVLAVVVTADTLRSSSNRETHYYFLARPRADH